VARRRVVVTGMGIVSPVGNSVSEAWGSVLNGRSGISPIDKFDVSAFTTKFSGSVRDFDPCAYIEAKEARKMDVFVQYGLAAGIQAIRHAGFECPEGMEGRVGVAMGSGIGGISAIEKNHEIVTTLGPRRISPFFVPGSIINMIAGNLAIMFGYKGPNIAITTACTTATHNIGMALRLIQYGDADVMVAGGAEMATTPVGLGGFCAARALSQRNDNPRAASRPWDRDRDGFVLSEGAGALVLEEYEFAKKRGATILAELVGFGMSDDAYHMTSPPEDGDGARAAMANAVNDAGITCEQLDYINAHGTSTNAGDLAETIAIKRLMGAYSKRVAVSSTKSMTGHALGAAGALEAIFSVLALRDQVAPPTINLDNPDVGCDLNFVPHTAQQMKVDYALSNSFGFGGTNGSILFRRI